MNIYVTTKARSGKEDRRDRERLSLEYIIVLYINIDRSIISDIAVVLSAINLEKVCAHITAKDFYYRRLANNEGEPKTSVDFEIHILL